MHGRESGGTGSRYAGILAAGARGFATAPLEGLADELGPATIRAHGHRVQAQMEGAVP